MSNVGGVQYVSPRPAQPMQQPAGGNIFQGAQSFNQGMQIGTAIRERKLESQFRKEIKQLGDEPLTDEMIIGFQRKYGARVVNPMLAFHSGLQQMKANRRIEAVNRFGFVNEISTRVATQLAAVPPDQRDAVFRNISEQFDMLGEQHPEVADLYNTALDVFDSFDDRDIEAVLAGGWTNEKYLAWMEQKLRAQMSADNVEVARLGVERARVTAEGDLLLADREHENAMELQEDLYRRLNENKQAEQFRDRALENIKQRNLNYREQIKATPENVKTMEWAMKRAEELAEEGENIDAIELFDAILGRETDSRTYIDEGTGETRTRNIGERVMSERETGINLTGDPKDDITLGQPDQVREIPQEGQPSAPRQPSQVRPSVYRQGDQEADPDPATVGPPERQQRERIEFEKRVAPVREFLSKQLGDNPKKNNRLLIRQSGGLIWQGVPEDMIVDMIKDLGYSTSEAEAIVKKAGAVRRVKRNYKRLGIGNE